MAHGNFYDNLSNEEKNRRIKARTRILDSRPVYAIYAWKGDEAICFPGTVHTVQAAAMAAANMAADWPHHKVSVYQVMMVVDPDETMDPTFAV